MYFRLLTYTLAHINVLATVVSICMKLLVTLTLINVYTMCKVTKQSKHIYIYSTV